MNRLTDPETTTNLYGEPGNGGNSRITLEYLAEKMANMADAVSNLSASMGNVMLRFDKLEGRFDKLEGRFDKLEGRFDEFEGRFDKLSVTVHGYIKRQSEIQEIQVRDDFESWLSNSTSSIFERVLDLPSIKDNNKREITEFDGLYTIESLGGLVVVIEAKHDLDKSKVDKKIAQLNRILYDPPNPPNIVLPEDVTRFRKMALTWITPKSMEPSKPDPAPKLVPNIVLLFSAGNISRHLGKYIEFLSNPYDPAKYDQLSFELLRSDDHKMIKKMMSLRDASINKLKNRNASSIVDVLKTIKFDNVDDLVRLRGVSIPIMEDAPQELKELVSLFGRFKEFIRPIDDLQIDKWNGRIGVVTGDGSPKYITHLPTSSVWRTGGGYLEEEAGGQDDYNQKPWRSYRMNERRQKLRRPYH